MSLLDVANNESVLMFFARKAFRYYSPDDFLDAVSDTRLELMERHNRNPNKKFHLPWQALDFATMTVARRYGRQWEMNVATDMTEIDLAVQPNQYDGERLFWEEFDLYHANPYHEMNTWESDGVKYKRECETRKALGTSPCTIKEWVEICSR